LNKFKTVNKDVLEEHDPNRALVGCYLDSFLGPPILVLAYRDSGRNAQDARTRSGADICTTTSTRFSGLENKK
jgi:hypothetical protein